LSYAIPQQVWDSSTGLPCDNIHAAIRDTGAAGPPFFSSAGCQTLPGDYDVERITPLGSFATLRAIAGLNPKPIFTNAARSATLDDGRRFIYVLLTGREARLATLPSGAVPLRRLRYGSTGDNVARLRARLGVSASNIFDRATMAALISWQLDNLGVADGILSPNLADKLHLEI
jgi:hypothetical protein